MRLFLVALAKIFNALPKTDKVLLHWCDLYGRYGLDAPNLVGMTSAPTVTTDASPSSITTTSAVFDTNSITSTGGENASVRGICWVTGAGGTPTTADSKHEESGSFSTGNFSRSMSGLSAGTTYSVRAYATNSAGTGFGSVVEVTTTAIVAPTVTTQAVSSIAQTTATGNGNVTADGGGTITERGVCWNTSTNPTTSNSKATSAGTTGAFTASMTGLAASTHYFVRAYAINSAGTSYGSNVEFDTLATTLTQAEAAFYEDGTENGSSVISGGADSITRDVSSGDSNLQLRMRLQNNTAGAGLSTDDYQLQYELNDSGTYVDANTSTDLAFDSYSESNRTEDFTSRSGFREAVAQSFTGGGGILSKATFHLSKTGSPTGNVTAYIYAHSGTFGTSSVGTGSALATSATVNIASLTTTPTLTDFAFTGANQITLTNSTKYVLVVSYTGGDGSNNLKVGADGSPAHGGNTAYANSISSPSWTADNTFDLCFYVYSLKPVVGFNSASLTDGNATTNRLGAGTGSFVAGEISEDGLVDNLQITASNYTELLYSLTLVSAALADTDTLDFRVLRNGATTGMTYTVTPRITVSKGGGGDDHELDVDDSALALTIDTTTITQNHVLTAQDAALALSMDNTTITQNHVIQPQDIALSLTTDNTTLAQTHVLPVDDLALALTEDATTISQDHVLAPADIALSLTVDNTTLTQDHVIASQDVALALTTDNASITETNDLTVQDIALALTTDNTTVEETNFNLTVQDISLALTEDNTTISQNHVVASQDIALALTTDNTTVTQNHVVDTDDIALALTTDNATVAETNFVLSTQDITLSLTEDSATITQNHIVVTQDIALNLTLDNTTLAQSHIVVVQHIALSLTMDNATIAETNFVLMVQDVLLSLSTDETTITQGHVLTAEDIALALTLDNVTLNAGTGGNIKVWNGFAYVAKPVKVWTGTSWESKTLKVFDSANWVATNY